MRELELVLEVNMEETEGFISAWTTGRPPQVIIGDGCWLNLLFFIEEQVEEIQMNNVVAIICSKMQFSTQMFQ